MLKKGAAFFIAAILMLTAFTAIAQEGMARFSGDGRRIITIGTWYNQFYFSRHNAITDDPKMAFPETAQMRLDNLRAVEKKHNVVLDYVNLTFDGLQESMNISIPEGSPDVDIYEVDIKFGIPAVMEGYAVSLEAMDLFGTDVFESQNVLQALSIPGQEESYLFAPSNTGSVNAYVLAFNMDMINAAGLENPQDLYDRGEWTWEAWRKYLAALTRDTDGDGTADIYGFSGYWTYLLRNLLFSNGAAIAAGPKETLSAPETVAVLQFINTLYNEDKTARPWDESNWDINNSLYAAGLSGFWIGSDWLFDEQGGADLPFEIGVVPWPCGPDGNKDLNSHSQPRSNWYFIPTGVKEPRFVYDVLFDWLNWYGGDLSLGADMKWSRSMYMTDRNFAYATMMDSKPGFDVWESLGVNIELTTMLKGERTPEDIAAEYAPQFQAALDRYFE